MIDEVWDFVVRNGAVEGDGVPMFFVHVVAGLDGSVLVTQREGQVGIAFERDAQRRGLPGDEGVHFADNFEDEGLRSKGLFFGGAVFLQHIMAQGIEFHRGSK